MIKLEESQTWVEPLAETAARMKRLAEILIPHTVPLVKPEYEEDINFLKLNPTFVDGYEVMLLLTKGFYETPDSGTYFLSSLRVINKYGSFLPFNILTKIARAFFGDRHVGYVEFVNEGQKHYCWTQCESEDCTPIPNPTKVKTVPASYEGWEFYRLDPSGVNFY